MDKQYCNFSSDLEFLNGVRLAELHMHISTSATPAILWDIAHAQGIRLPTKDFFEFADLVTIRKATDYENYLKMYDLLEFIQSSPDALFMLTEQVCGHLYQENNMNLLEIRMNPLLRTQGGKIDLDHLIVFALQGMERAMLKFPLKVGLILSMDRRFTHHENEAILKKAIKYKDRGIIGVDLAGPISRTDQAKQFKPSDIADLMATAREAGLGVTVHTGEATDTEEMWQVLNDLKPDRIGHGIACINDTEMMKHLRENDIVLETCPSSNLKTSAIKDLDDMRRVYGILRDNQVKFTINTDGPILQQTTLRREYALLYNEQILSAEELLRANEIAHEATFIK
ncbi:MAG: hypothetical protein LBG64_03590 [Pseudomonadales bacterium]|jgi:adenosine deaminase|nr:hypothetical protein [Pseudomonadales bacterium]